MQVLLAIRSYIIGLSEERSARSRCHNYKTLLAESCTLWFFFSSFLGMLIMTEG